MLVPNRNWRADTVLCDVEGTEWFVLMECDDSMRSYEAIFGDMYGHKLVCVRRKMMRAVWDDGFYICTYKPNFPNQPPLYERDCNNSTYAWNACVVNDDTFCSFAFVYTSALDLMHIIVCLSPLAS